MFKNNGQLPPDFEFDDIIPQTNNATEKVEKNTFDMRNYLDFSIPEGKKTREITIRLLPVNPQTKELFQIVHLHNITVNKELNPNKSGKKAYMCLSAKNKGIDHDTYGSNCPVCEAQKELWNKWHNESDPSIKKELQKELSSLNIREYCIVRCIERGKEEDGPKFWRIPLRQDETDAYHKMVLLAKTRQKEGEEAGVNINIFSLYHGRDLIVTFTDGTGAPTVVDKGISTPITRDEELLNKWYYDEKKWSDVFSTKPYDYLKLAYEGEVPWFDRENKKWVSKREFESKNEVIEDSVNSNIKKIEELFTNSNNNNHLEDNSHVQTIITNPVSVNNIPSIDDDNLPF